MTGKFFAHKGHLIVRSKNGSTNKKNTYYIPTVNILLSGQNSRRKREPSSLSVIIVAVVARSSTERPDDWERDPVVADTATKDMYVCMCLCMSSVSAFHSSRSILAESSLYSRFAVWAAPATRTTRLVDICGTRRPSQV